MSKTVNSLENLDIYFDIMIEKQFLIERIHTMNAEDLWYLQSYVNHLYQKSKPVKLPLTIGV